MNDIFLSYAREDRAWAQRLAVALGARGWRVWWDTDIPPGETFDEAIQEALDNTRCVVVLWSERSIESNWVKEEAAEGARRKILVPCLVDEVRIPLGFGRIQAARLVDWDGEPGHPGFDQLSSAIASIIGPPSASGKLAGADLKAREKESTGGREPVPVSTGARSGKRAVVGVATGQPQAIREERARSVNSVTPVANAPSTWRRFGARLLGVLTLAGVFTLAIICAGLLIFMCNRGVLICTSDTDCTPGPQPGVWVVKEIAAGTQVGSDKITIVGDNEDDHEFYLDALGLCALTNLKCPRRLRIDDVDVCVSDAKKGAG